MSAALPALITPHRRRWLIALVANGLARALMAACGLVLLRWALSDGQAPMPIGQLLSALATGVVVQAWLQRRERMDAEALCPRRSNFDPPCRLNFDPGLVAEIA